MYGQASQLTAVMQASMQVNPSDQGGGAEQVAALVNGGMTASNSPPRDDALLTLSLLATKRRGREQDVRTGKGQGEASKAKDAKQAKPN